MDMRILKFDIYQSTIAPNYLRVTKTLDTPISSKKKTFCLMSDLKFTLPDVTSFLLDNLYGLLKIVFRLVNSSNARNFKKGNLLEIYKHSKKIAIDI